MRLHYLLREAGEKVTSSIIYASQREIINLCGATPRQSRRQKAVQALFKLNLLSFVHMSVHGPLH